MTSLECDDVTKMWTILKRFSNSLQYLWLTPQITLSYRVVVDNLFKKAKKTCQIDIMTSKSDVDIHFLKICRVHVSLETNKTLINLSSYSQKFN